MKRTLLPYIFLFLISFSLVLLLSACGALDIFSPTSTPSLTPSPSSTATLEPTQTLTPLPADAISTFILSLSDNGYAHLFAFSPEKLPLTRISNGLWDDVSPSFSPDGQKIVFASNRNDYWDLYLLDLTSGQVQRLTDTPEYDGNPSWSPDGQWIVYETYIDSNLEISIHSTVNASQIIRLSNNPAADRDPVWSPGGRKIAFVSNRSGDDEIWIADLDQPEAGRFVNLSQSPDGLETHPAWSPDGTQLAWASARPDQPEGIYLWDSKTPDVPARRIGSGGWPAWNDNGGQIAALFRDPNQNYLVAYSLDGSITLPTTPLSAMHGIDWSTIRVGALPRIFQKAALLTPTLSWESQVRHQTDIPNERVSVVKLNSVQAPHPFLHDAVDEAFTALRKRVILETGWDALASLSDAYEPLTSSLDPGKGEDWLYTGRAFTLNSLTLNVGWMMVVREDMAGQTYWRVYLRALAQDGAQGEPLSSLPWDLNARYNLDPQPYDQGGALMKSIPIGYWVDFTNLANEYGWQRIAAQNNWRTYFVGTQFNEFVMNNGLDWRTAMLELYPPDVFITPTIVIPPTLTKTKTLIPYAFRSPTPTRTLTPTPHPTFTPAP
jgi:TolB protein